MMNTHDPRKARLLLDDSLLFTFQQALLRNGLCRPAIMPGYLFSLEVLSEYYLASIGKGWAVSPDSDTFFQCQMGVLRQICEPGERLVILPDHWLLEFDMEGGGTNGA